jgi:hypothetical protein
VLFLTYYHLGKTPIFMINGNLENEVQKGEPKSLRIIIFNI